MKHPKDFFSNPFQLEEKDISFSEKQRIEIRNYQYILIDQIIKNVPPQWNKDWTVYTGTGGIVFMFLKLYKRSEEKEQKQKFLQFAMQYLQVTLQSMEESKKKKKFEKKRY